MEPVVPKDIPLGLPAPFGLLEFLLLLSFALHIVFVNLMLGGSVMVAVAQALSRRNRDWERICREIAKTVTVNKSMAVVLGVAPLLTISVLYTPQFYTSSILIGHAWLSVIPLVILAFLLGYAHHYAWAALSRRWRLHLGLAVSAAVLFLIVPLIFLANVNLMLYPERWRETDSLWKALLLPNVLPRYLHFLAASMAIVGLFMSIFLGRRRGYAKLGLSFLTREALVRAFYRTTLIATASQLVLGPLVYFTLPDHVVSPVLPILVFAVVLPLAAALVVLLWREIRADVPGERVLPILGLIIVIPSLMVIARHDVRETALRPHRALVAARTAEYTQNVRSAQNYLVMPGGLEGKPLGPGGLLFQRKCASCHAFDRKLVGPPLNEVIKPYRGDPEGIVNWALVPGRKRQDYPAMPAQEIPKTDLLQIAAYILETTGNR